MITNARAHQSGSAFFIILIGIAMFAALSYAVFRGGSGSESMLTQEQARMAAQEMISIADSVQKAVQSMRLRGVAETELDISTSVYTTIDGSTPNTANSSCTNNGCKVYNIEGGKVTPLIGPDTVAIDQSYQSGATMKSGHARFYVGQIAGIGTSAPDLFIQFPFINETVCKAINDLVGVTNPSGRPPTDASGTLTAFKGNITTFPNPAGFGIGDEAPELVGKSTYCRKSGSAFYFEAIILAR